MYITKGKINIRDSVTYKIWIEIEEELLKLEKIGIVSLPYVSFTSMKHVIELKIPCKNL